MEATTTIPARSRAIGGTAGALRIEEGATPSPGPRELLIRVHAAGVNRADVYQSKGEYPVPPGASPILGLEVAGTVAAVGPEVSEWRPGDRVMALVTGGGYAEYCVAPAATTMAIPARLGFVEAAAVPEAYFTVWLNLVEVAGLRAGETVLVQGGTSGIGSAAIPIAKALGATVITTAGTDEKCAACRELGADLAINYRTGDFVEAARRFAQERGTEPGVDVVLDWIGADYLERHVAMLRRGGRLVLIDSWSGRDGKLDLMRLVGRSLRVCGSVLRSRTVAEKSRSAEGIRRELWPRLDAGTLVPRVSHRFPLERADEAHRVMVESVHIGKIVLEP